MPSTNLAGHRLPSGDDLAAMVWDALAETLAGHLTSTPIEKPWPVAPAGPMVDYNDLFGIRLEHLMEIVFRSGRDLGQQQCVGRWFATLCANQFAGARPATTHYALLALCHGPQLTLNFDTLLESAGANDVEHLHGRVDDPASLVTTISQYQLGLPAETQHRLRHLLTGRNLLVAGYSGRDRDVLPLLTACRPASITWLHYPGSDASREVRELRDRGLIRFEVTSLEDFAHARGDHRPPQIAVHATPPMPGPTAMPQIPMQVAGDAILETLTEQNTELAYAFLRDYQAARLPQSPRFERLKGRLQGQTGRSGAALRSFLSPRSARMNSNELAALATRALGWQLPNRAVALISRSAFMREAKQTEFSARQRLAHQQNLRGDVASALASDSRDMWLGDGVVSSQVQVNALLFHSDRLRVAGRIREAQHAQEAALIDAPYASPRLRSYLLLMRGHLHLCRGEVDSCLAALDHSDALIHRQPGTDGPTYPQGAWNDLVRSNALMVDGALDLAHDLIAPTVALQKHETPLGGVLARLHLVELHALRDDPAAMSATITALRRYARDTRTRAPHLLAAADLIRTEVTGRPDADTHDWLVKLADWYGRRGYHLARARTLTTQHRLFGDGVAAAHITAWRAEGLEPLIDWSLTDPLDRRPHWILPF